MRCQLVVQTQLYAPMQMDVEGHEPHAMASAKRLIETHRVDNIVMEYSPNVAEKVSGWGWVVSLVRDEPTYLGGWACVGL